MTGWVPITVTRPLIVSGYLIISERTKKRVMTAARTVVPERRSQCGGRCMNSRTSVLISPRTSNSAGRVKASATASAGFWLSGFSLVMAR